jgi:glc operon protein GlcG
MADITLTEALAMLSAATEQAHAAGNPIAVAVLDRAGIEIAAQRMDGMFPSGGTLARKKAYGALNLGQPTHVAIEGYPAPVQAALIAAEPAVSFLPGGMPVLRDGAVVGAIGVTGGTGEQDVACCDAALKALDGAAAER